MCVKFCSIAYYRRELFAHLQRRQEYENSQENHGVQYTVFCSFLQIYNERLLDLLTDSKPINTPKDLANVPKLTIHESGYVNRTDQTL